MGRRIRTVSGDAWDMIAKREYGSERCMSLLIQANPDYIEVEIFPANVLIDVPDVPVLASSAENLPPWKI